MKTIIIDGEEYQYDIYAPDDDDCGSPLETHFYKGFTTKIRKKYWLFGEKITKQVPTFAFYIKMDIESPSYSKLDVITKIREKLNEIEAKNEAERIKLERIKEIERGEII